MKTKTNVKAEGSIQAGRNEIMNVRNSVKAGFAVPATIALRSNHNASMRVRSSVKAGATSGDDMANVSLPRPNTVPLRSRA